jgi:hypothetical protein
MRHRAVLVGLLALSLSVSCANPLSAIRGVLPAKSSAGTGPRSSPAADAEILKAPCQIEQDGYDAMAAASSVHVLADITWTQGRSRHADEWFSVPDHKAAGTQILEGTHVDIVSVNGMLYVSGKDWIAAFIAVGTAQRVGDGWLLLDQDRWGLAAIDTAASCATTTPARKSVAVYKGRSAITLTFANAQDIVAAAPPHYLLLHEGRNDPKDPSILSWHFEYDRFGDSFQANPPASYSTL